jgi:hypothetical protein
LTQVLFQKGRWKKLGNGEDYLKDRQKEREWQREIASSRENSDRENDRKKYYH